MRPSGSDLVEEDGGEADAKRGGDDGEASFGPAVLSENRRQTRVRRLGEGFVGQLRPVASPVVEIHGSPALLVPGARQALVPAAVQGETIQDLVEGRRLAFHKQVQAAHLGTEAD